MQVEEIQRATASVRRLYLHYTATGQTAIAADFARVVERLERLVQPQSVIPEEVGND